jgi:Fur family peroxide stress response transcriptional regulator
MLTDSQVQENIAVFKQKCRNAGLKVTPQRVAVYQELVGTTEHPSADMLHRSIKSKFSNISLDTVNRTLLTFSDIGLAFVVPGSGDVRRFDGGMTDHQHFRCVKCKRIIDFHHEPFDVIETPKEISDKFTILKKTVYFEGICNICTKA